MSTMSMSEQGPGLEKEKKHKNLEEGENEPQVKKIKHTVYEAGDWIKRWEENKIGFHEAQVHPLLKKYENQLLDGKENVTVFFPLCGKTVDMKWLADNGHSIIGVELCEIGIKQFFEEQQIEYKIRDDKEMNVAVYESKDGKIQIYNCNLFDFKKNDDQDIEAIWDRGSFVAINRDDRKKYSDMIMSLMSDTTNYFLITVDYDENIHPGPPHFVSEEGIAQLFGEKCNIKQLHYHDAFQEKHAKWGLSSLNERLHHISKKH